MLKNYSTKKNNWIKHWLELEKEGNVGLDYFINPVLYPLICNEMNKIRKSVVVDFGAGTNFLANEILAGDKEKIFGLKKCKDLEGARKKIKRFVGVEESKSLIRNFKSKISSLNFLKTITLLNHKIELGNLLPFKSRKIDLAISRNFFMHLSIEELDYHLDEVSRILKKDRVYVVSFLNPEYEKKKFKGKLINNQEYEFKHGREGEKGYFTQHYKDLETYEKLFSKQFKILEKHPCKPLTEKFKKTHSRYYWKDNPLAFVYKLKNIK